MTTRTFAGGAGNLLINGGFEDGLNEWTSTIPAGSYSYSVVSDGSSYPHAFSYRRWNSGSDGGTAGLWQNLDLLVSDYSALYVELDVKVVSNTLHNSGWWSNTYGGSGEWPAIVGLTYEDKFGTVWTWVHGFFPDDNNENYGRTNFEYVARNQWRHYLSPNLVDVTTTTTAPHNVPLSSPPPYHLKTIFVGGSGWDYEGLFDSVRLWGDRIIVGGTTASMDPKHPLSAWITTVVGIAALTITTSVLARRKRFRET